MSRREIRGKEYEVSRMSRVYASVETPLGEIWLGASEAGLAEVVLPGGGRQVDVGRRWSESGHPVLEEARRQLEEYFLGKRREFQLPLAPEGTAFQKRVWKALEGISYGTTCSYGELARRVGCAGGARAVGQANHNNPLAIVVPCHRVVGADGSLTGYAGGLETKRWLLEFELRSLRNG